MKKIYRALLIITLFCLFYTLSVILKESVDLSIPSVKTTIEVEEWDRESSAKEIYLALKSYAQANNVDVHKIVFSTDSEGNELKKIFTFSAGEKSNYSYNSTDFQTKVLFFDSSELTNENLVGSYALTEKLPQSAKADFESLGLIVNIEKVSVILIFLGSLFSTIGLLSTILIFATILANVFSKIAQMKKYGIWEIHGKSIALLSFKENVFDIVIITCSVAVFIFVYPVFWKIYILIGIIIIICTSLFNMGTSMLICKSEKTIEKIKGKRPSNVSIGLNLALKIVILVVFVFFTASLSAELKKNNEAYKGLSQWKKNSNYYQLHFSNATTLFPNANKSEQERKKEFIEINKKLYPLFEEAESNGGILAVNNEYFLNEVGGSSLYIDSVPFMTVNHNFLTVFSITDYAGNKLNSLSDNKFYVLIPEKEKVQTKRIEQEVGEVISIYQNLYDESSNNFKGEWETIYVASDQEVFNFNAEYPEYSLSKNPIILVVSLKAIGTNVGNLIANVSQGQYLFSNKDQVNQFIEKNKLEEEFFGLISAQDSAINMLKRNRHEYSLKIVALVILFIIFILVQFYISLSYVELNQKKLFLQYIFGMSFFTRHYLYSLIVLLVSFATLGLITSFDKEYFPIVCSLLIFETLLLFFTIIISEKFKRLDIIKKEN